MSVGALTQTAGDRAEITTVVGGARRRVMVDRAFWEASLAATVALLGPTMFLLLGRRLFVWPLFIVFALAGLGLGAWRWRKRRPGTYEVSQVLDARLRTHDQISTAIYFLNSQEPPATGQRRVAASIARQIDLEAAFPFTLPRSLYGLASIFLIASGLWAIRYFLEKPPRMEKSLARLVLQKILPEELLARERRDAAEQPRNAAQKQSKAQVTENQELGPHGEFQQGRETSDAASDASPENTDQGRKPGDDKNNAAGDASKDGDAFGDPIASDSENDAIQSYEDMLQRDAKSGLQKADGKQGKDSNGNQGENRAGSNESNSLLSKLRDAMNNMLSRLQQKSSGAGQQQAAQGASQNGNGQKEGSGEARSGSGQPKAGGQEAADSEGAESEAQDLSAQNPNGKNGGKSSEQGSRGSSGSGAGRQEGDKQLAEAQLQEAMGKLTELYGRRAANVTGEVTVETQSGKQTLRTPQSQKQARHSDAGGEVSRDEIPLAYQAYVKEYFNRLRQGGK